VNNIVVRAWLERRGGGNDPTLGCDLG